MDLWEAARVVARHWVVVAVGLVLAVVATVRTYAGTEPSFEAHGSGIVIGTSAQLDPATQRLVDNPYGGQRDLLASAKLAGEIGRGDAVNRYVKAHGGYVEDYIVNVDPNAPIIGVVAAGTDPVRTVRTARAVLDGLSEEFRARQVQVGVPASGLVRVDVLSVPAKAIEVNAPRVKSTALILALGVVASFSLAFLAEAVAGAWSGVQRRDGPRRRRAKEGRGSEGATPPPARDGAEWPQPAGRGRARV